jgi:hypothetical protein
MRTFLGWCLALVVVALACELARGQAGRYIPPPELPIGPGLRFVPHIPLPGGGGAVVPAIVVCLASLGAGLALGDRIGRWWRGVPADTQPAAPDAFPAIGASWPLPPDLIRSPEEVADKAARTTRLLDVLAGRDRVFEPTALRHLIHDTFCQVQECWQERNYGPVQERLMPVVLAKHEGQLREMWRHGEINRIDDLNVARLEFVHVVCPADQNGHEVTALITFEARVYFVDDRTGAFRRGADRPAWYQEFWTFCRGADGWRLAHIRPSRDAAPLHAPNEVSGMDQAELRAVEEGAVLQ